MFLGLNLTGKNVERAKLRLYAQEIKVESCPSLPLSVFQDHLCETLPDPLFHPSTPVRLHETSIPFAKEGSPQLLDGYSVLPQNFYLLLMN
jgi:hypothetical protein